MSENQARKWQADPQYTPQKESKTVVRKVKKTPWITKGEKVIYSVTGAAILAFGIGVVSYASGTDTLNREMQQLEDSINSQVIINENLNFEREELSRPERIIEIAEKNGLKIQNSEVKQAETVNN
ncbi:cell division protein FtsL [Oceanobacillus sp. CFH 90083]|uniref:cell division protein FtsL n=1 Tax=Oceanobacillus sp. CFH 90083 TaxID=2592336 RepID=UPI00128E7B73|nr:cell division protein FtsL [Oceanobacillus sp. CFH 90083]